MKITVTKTETIEQEVDLTFPCYFKSGDTSFVKVLNESLALHVWTPKTVTSHANIKYTGHVGNYLAGGILITEEEFDAAYKLTLDQFNKDFETK